MTKYLPFLLDRTSRTPLYDQLAAQFRQAIDRGELRPGDAFENEISLAARLHVSRPTVRRAIGELASQGILVRRRGIGTRVANQVVQPGDEVTSLYDDLISGGRRPGTILLRLESGVVNAHAAHALGLEPGTPLTYVERLRTVDGQPLAHLVNWLPPFLGPVTEADLQSEGLYAMLRRRGHAPVSGSQVIRARNPSGAQRRLLGLTRGDAVLWMVRQTADADGVGVEYGEHCFRGDEYAFRVKVRGSDVADLRVE